MLILECDALICIKIGSISNAIRGPVATYAMMENDYYEYERTLMIIACVSVFFIDCLGI